MKKGTNPIKPAEIKGQIARICQSAEFKSKRLLCLLLNYLTDQAMAGNSSMLKGYSIGVAVFGKDKHFDPEQDSLVRIHAGRLRRGLEMYYLMEGKNDPIQIEIPKGSYEPIFTRHENIDSNDNMASPISRKPRLAVLPFLNLTGDPTKDYFSFGFSEELSLELTRYDHLTVVKCFNRPDSNNSISLADRYGTDYIIDGCVQLNNDKVRFIINLIDAQTSSQIWSTAYNKDLSIQNIIEVELDIADAIAKTIGSETGVLMNILADQLNRLRPSRLSVFDAMLKFYYYEGHISPALTMETASHLQSALVADPDSGLLHAMMASITGSAYVLDYPNSEEALAQTIELSNRAVALDPSNPLVRIINAFRYFICNDKPAFIHERDHCLSINLNSPARYATIGFYTSLYGEWEIGKKLLDGGMNQQVGYPAYFHGATCLYYYRASDYAMALNEARKYTIEELFWGPMLRMACLGQLERIDEAKNEMEHLLLLKPDFNDKAELLISHFVKEPSLVEHVMDGLNKAGLYTNLARAGNKINDQ